ncbi:Avirulence (Avh) protein [Phytophthora megakarya]|uniref:RxLR effector protein n=1 Tax=Phytophthora megakarya TaxID=4795 RepID=A0A225WRS1_9STRA|nr:Avirulence (Avh) protein [Phytophthora megakarya]
MLFAAVLVASGPEVSKADQAGVPDVGVVDSSNILTSEDKRFLRSHQAADNDDRYDEKEKRPEGEGEERKGGENLFAALKLTNMKRDPVYANKVYRRWKNYGYTVDDVEKKKVTEELRDKYQTFLSMWTKSGWEYPHYRTVNGYS